ncbi:MAG: sigma-54-dependent transcriptional regulator, partial [Planctomycetota bacterium]
MESSKEQERILVVDDAPATLELFQRHLTDEGYLVFASSCLEEAVRLIEETPVDLVITDLRMPGPDGMDLVRYVRENFKDTEVMMVTGFATIENAVEAVKVGAEEYLTKPVTDDELLAAVRRALNKLHLRRAGNSPPCEAPAAPAGLIGTSSAMCEVFNAISKAASTDATALIAGECGTGKELVARAIHYGSGRAAAPFVPVNCGSIPETLLESELFGHVKGAFTGATETRAGFFQTAEGGTIFLDEVSDTSLAMQA